jgi:flavin reductase (DIM6/NTAB) family NADH-FMN oxidoreductase RutF
MTGEALRALVRRLPAGVAVVTVDTGTHSLGLTVTAFVTLSLEPPLVGVAVARAAALHELLREAGAFGISLLAAGQETLAAHFARGVPPIALWTGVEVRPGETGAPLLEDALGWVECRLETEHAVGTHTLFVGAVVNVEHGTGTAALLRVEGGYRAA